MPSPPDTVDLNISKIVERRSIAQRIEWKASTSKNHTCAATREIYSTGDEQRWSSNQKIDLEMDRITQKMSRAFDWIEGEEEEEEEGRIYLKKWEV